MASPRKRAKAWQMPCRCSRASKALVLSSDAARCAYLRRRLRKSWYTRGVCGGFHGAGEVRMGEVRCGAALYGVVAVGSLQTPAVTRRKGYATVSCCFRCCCGVIYVGRKRIVTTS